MTKKNSEYDLADFIPYLLNQAAEASSLDFQRYYKGKYGMLRTEWRVIFHLGRYGEMTARDICERARIHKTKVSRAVAALQRKRYLTKMTKEADHRCENLCLTKNGMSVYIDLRNQAQKFNAKLLTDLTATECNLLKDCLKKISGL